jgi:hypothetical protein
LVKPNHPLLTIALNCLQDVESERPLVQWICKRVAVLKESTEYTESAEVVDKEEKHDIVNGTRRQRQEVASDEIVRLNELIHQKDEVIAAKEREIEELKKQVADNILYYKDQQWEQPSQADKGQY